MSANSNQFLEVEPRFIHMNMDDLNILLTDNQVDTSILINIKYTIAHIYTCI